MQKEKNNANNGSTTLLGGHQACASCKHQRKKCAEDCVLAPLFPATRTQEFNAVHKFFGVSNVSKLLKSIPKEEDRKKAAESLIWEAMCRIKDPVLGPLGEYIKLSEELEFYRSQMGKSSCPKGGPIGWNGPSNNNIGSIGGGYHGIMNGISNSPNNGGNYRDIMINDDGGSVFESNRIYNPSTKLRVSDRMDVGPMIVSGRPYIKNNINQQYYLSGQYNSNINGKTAETNLWEDET